MSKPEQPVREKRLVKIGDRWFYRERFGNSESRTDVTHEIDDIIDAAIAKYNQGEKS